MAERINEDATKALVVREKSLREKLSLNPIQEKVLSDITLKYLRDNRFEFRRANLDAAAGVIGDCLLRGLLLSQKTEIKPNDNLRELVKKGLENRNQIKVGTKEAVRYNHDPHFVADCPYIGPFAFPISTLNYVKGNFRTFELIGNAEIFESLAVEFARRSEVLGEISEFALSTLPKEKFPNSKPENFPTFEEKAKIVRNMIVSLAFRDSPLPVLWIEELRNYAVNNGKIAKRFDQKLLAKTIELLANAAEFNSEDVAPYITGLFYQVRQRFLSAKISSQLLATDEDLVRARDDVYRQFSDVLLLFHPALEEPEMVTNPNKAGESPYSLWREDLSIEIDGRRIPTPLGLKRARRLSEAKGISPDRIREGLKAWRTYEENLRRDRAKIVKLNQDISEITKKIGQVFDEDPKTRSEIIDLMEDWGRIEFSVLGKLESRHRANLKVINDEKRQFREALAYTAQLAGENNGELPLQAKMPQKLYEDLIRRQVMRRKNIYSKAVEKLIDEYGNIASDMLNYFNFVRINWREASDDFIESEMKELRLLAKRLKSGKVSDNIASINQSDLSPEDMLEHIDTQREKINKRKNIRRTLAGDRERTLNLGTLRGRISATIKGVKGTSYERLKIRFFKFSAKDRVKRFEEILIARKRIRATMNKDEEISSSWDREKIVSWLNKSKASNFAEFGRRIEDRLPELKSDMQIIYGWLSHHSRAGTVMGPDLIDSKNGLVEWINTEIASINTQIESTKSTERRKQIEGWKEGMFVELLEIVKAGNQVLPLKWLPMKREDFWEAVYRRRIYIEAQDDLKKTKAEYDDYLNRVFMPRAQRVVRRYLVNRKKSLQTELTELQKEPAKTRFLGKMDSLQFVLEGSKPDS